MKKKFNCQKASWLVLLNRNLLVLWNNKNYKNKTLNSKRNLNKKINKLKIQKSNFLKNNHL